MEAVIVWRRTCKPGSDVFTLCCCPVSNCNAPPQTIVGSPVVKLPDYEKQIDIDIDIGATGKIEMPQSGVLHFLTADGVKVSVRPSGTEPKIKIHIRVKKPLPSVIDCARVNRTLDGKIRGVASVFGL